MKSLKDLNPNPSNPRKITDEILNSLQKSLVEFGDLSGFVFNRTTNRLVGGHQRQKVLPDVPIVIDKIYSEPTKAGTIAEGHLEIDGEIHKYREVLWDEVKEKAANIAANKHGGSWDYDILSDWLIDLDSHNIDLDLTGFDKKEIEGLLVGKADKIIDDSLIDVRQYIVAITCKDELQMQSLFEELQGRGFECKLIT
jgi:hypothetical protein